MFWRSELFPSLHDFVYHDYVAILIPSRFAIAERVRVMSPILSHTRFVGPEKAGVAILFLFLFCGLRTGKDCVDNLCYPPCGPREGRGS